MSKSRIVVDARMIGPHGHGIARYVQLMAEGLGAIQEKKGLSYELLFMARPGITLQKFATVEVKTPFLHPMELLEIPKILRDTGASLYHSPSFSSLITAPCPWIVTIHDLIHLRFGTLPQRIYYRSLLRPFARRAKRLLTVSEFSRSELAHWVKLDRSNIDVVYNPIERPRTQGDDGIAMLARFGLKPRSYFLCLSSAKPHKNMHLLLRAFHGYRRQANASAWPLVVTASGLPKVPGALLLGGVDEQVAEALLSQAGGLLYPSLLEGFGRPPLEAAVRGVPVAVSRIPSHEEALAEFRPHEVMWIGARDYHGWVNAFHRISRDEIASASEETRQKVLERFSVGGMADHMDRIYTSVLDS